MIEQRQDPANIAYSIVKGRGQPVATRELIDLVMQELAVTKDGDVGRQMAQIHTAISLDSRFLTVIKGSWGLREWQAKPKPRVTAAVRAAAQAQTSGLRRRLDNGDEMDDDDSEALEVEDDSESDWD